jgi:UDP-glucose 4-epimerase
MIIVTGATGFVGSHLIRRLNKAGKEVKAIGGRPADITYPGFFDICMPEPTCEIEAFVHLAAAIPAKVKDVKSDIFLRTNTLGTFYALEFCRRRGIRKFIFTTTLYAGIENASPITEAMGRKYSLTGDHAAYVVSKIAAEDLIAHYDAEYGMQGIILRMTGLTGHGRQEGAWSAGTFYPSAFEVFYRKAKAGQPIEIWGNHQARRDSLYVKDATRAILAAIKSPTARGLYGIGSGSGRTVEEEALIFTEVFESPKPIYKPEIPVTTRSYWFDISKAERELGWKPEYSFKDTVIDYDKDAAC